MLGVNILFPIRYRACLDVLCLAGVGGTGVDAKKAQAAAAEDDSKDNEGSKAFAESQARTASLKAQLEKVKEQETALLDDLHELKAEIEALKARLPNAGERGGDGAGGDDNKGPFVKPLWAYSPSGRWNPGLWMRAWDRGGIISCEYGEPAQSMAFVGSPLVEEEQALALTA